MDPFKKFLSKFSIIEISEKDLSNSKYNFSEYSDNIEEIISELSLSVTLSEHYIKIHELSFDNSAQEFETKYSAFIKILNTNFNLVESYKEKLGTIKEIALRDSTNIESLVEDSYKVAVKLANLLGVGIESLITLLNRIRRKLSTKENFYGFEYPLNINDVNRLIDEAKNGDLKEKKLIHSILHLSFSIAYIEDELICSDSNIHHLRKLKDQVFNLNFAKNLNDQTLNLIKNKIDFLLHKTESRRKAVDQSIDRADNPKIDTNVFSSFYTNSNNLYNESYYLDKLNPKQIINYFEAVCNKNESERLLINFNLFSKLFRKYTNRIDDINYFNEVKKLIQSIDCVRLKKVKLKIPNSLINKHSRDSFEVRKLALIQEIDFKKKYLEVISDNTDLTFQKFTKHVEEIEKILNDVTIKTNELTQKNNTFTKFFINYNKINLLSIFIEFIRKKFDDFLLDSLVLNEGQETEFEILLSNQTAFYLKLQLIHNRCNQELSELLHDLEIARQSKTDPIYLPYNLCLYTYKYTTSAEGDIDTRIGFLDSSYIYPTDFRKCRENLYELRNKINFSFNALLTRFERKTSLLKDINQAKFSFKDSLKELESKAQLNSLQVVSLFVALITFIMGGIKITYDTILGFPKTNYTKNFPIVENKVNDSLVQISRKTFNEITHEIALNNKEVVMEYSSKIMPFFLVSFAASLLFFIIMGRLMFTNLKGYWIGTSIVFAFFLIFIIILTYFRVFG